MYRRRLLRFMRILLFFSIFQALTTVFGFHNAQEMSNPCLHQYIESPEFTQLHLFKDIFSVPLYYSTTGIFPIKFNFLHSACSEHRCCSCCHRRLLPFADFRSFSSPRWFLRRPLYSIIISFLVFMRSCVRPCVRACVRASSSDYARLRACVPQNSRIQIC